MPVHPLACADLINDHLVTSYENLPADRYLGDGHVYRYRTYGQTVLAPGELRWSLEVPFFQSKRFNSHAGGIHRTFAPPTAPVREFSQALALRSQERGIVPPGRFILGCHQIRVVASEDHTGLPTPEGFHQDGFAWVLIACVARRNADGAVTTVRRLSDASAPVYEGALGVGDALLLEDPMVEHYVSPLTPQRPGRAHRDVVVVTLASFAEEGHSV
ncbi:2OG-Fe dioxygenase family protein [Streptomyces sp. MUM 16J]|uniref:2OG-Fe dioxygenase family protein n=1 Tax=Streptomyces sp. MUM 16J TaxID=2791988 RepID=UPI001F043D05|nr:2OG-Fe dioxygenase family protein [Streptomyces sp. MUM 16J]MCH0557961.1 2OG-Fe dioxygenase family protein [Streptomyces sp. MUM 16J]